MADSKLYILMKTFLDKTFLDKTILQDPNPMFICGLCDGVLTNPIEVSDCDHSFCKNCVDYIYRNYGDITMPLKCIKCIQDNTTSQGVINDLEKIDQYILSQLKTTLVCCKNTGCKWSGRYVALKEHLQEFCDYEPIACPVSKCVILKCELEDHINNCHKDMINSYAINTELKVNKYKDKFNIGIESIKHTQCMTKIIQENAITSLELISELDRGRVEQHELITKLQEKIKLITLATIDDNSKTALIKRIEELEKSQNITLDVIDDSSKTALIKRIDKLEIDLTKLKISLNI